MEKKAYNKPLMFAEEFVPQSFVAACSADEDYVTYHFECDAKTTGWFQGNSFHVYFDNGDGVFDKNSDQNAFPNNTWAYSPCGETHDITVHKGESIDNVFPKGWLVPLVGLVGWEMPDRARMVRIYQPEPGNYNNTHCTFQLSESEFHISNPS